MLAVLLMPRLLCCTREAGGGRERARLEPQRPIGVLPGEERCGRDRQIVGGRP